jgi:glutamyl-tRNA synthetase
MSEGVRVRFAPAPTGRLHIGNARTTLHNWLFARHHGGAFLLRIEDTDQLRSTQENVDLILEAIRWLNLDWDEGPEVGGDYGPYFQSQRLDLYGKAASRLVEEGKAYPCYCTPEELAERRREMQTKGLPPRYDRQCRSLSQAQRERMEAEGRPKAVRFATPESGLVQWDDLVRGAIEFQNAELDDFVVVKSDGFPTYLLACVVDDSAMAISHVLRGEDILSSTPRQLHIYQALGLPIPEFAHLPLLLGPDRSKLAGRHGAVSVTEYRDQGYLPEAVVNFIALLGWSPGGDREILSREEMIQEFSLAGVGKSGAVYLRGLPAEEYVSRGRPFVESALGDLSGDFDDTYFAQALLLEQPRAKTLSDLPALTEFFFREPEGYEEKGEKKWFRREGAVELLAALQEALHSLTDFDAASLEAAVRKVADAQGLKAGPAIHTTRLATTGRTTGPGLFELLELLGRDRVLRRLTRAQQHVRSLT